MKFIMKLMKDNNFKNVYCHLIHINNFVDPILSSPDNTCCRSNANYWSYHNIQGRLKI